MSAHCTDMGKGGQGGVLATAVNPVPAPHNVELIVQVL